MKPRSFLLFISSLVASALYAQTIPAGFVIQPVNQKFTDFPYAFDMSTPLKTRIVLNYIWTEGKENLYCKIHAERQRIFDPPDTAADVLVSDRERDYYGNAEILEVISYHDSVAAVVTKYKEGRFSAEIFEYTDHKWYYVGGDPLDSPSACRIKFFTYAAKNLEDLRKSCLFAIPPADTNAFVTFLRQHSDSPLKFMLGALKTHRLVMYGEIHSRKVSWDFLTSLINDPEFALHTGVIFIEMASGNQEDMDRFMNKDTTDRELLLKVFREYMLTGWDDKARFDFLMDVRTLNRELPADKRIRVLLVDTPRPFSTFKSREDFDRNAAEYNRDEYMAARVLEGLKQTDDQRSGLFIVGAAHLCYSLNNAGRRLRDTLPAGSTFSVFTHCPRMDNIIPIHERIRHGMFDYAFYRNGNQPLAFLLKGSPFGAEPFDGLYYDGNGKYEENYDGYIFLGPLDTEPDPGPLEEMYSEDFIREMDRRCQLTYGSSLQEAWGLETPGRESVIRELRSIHKPLKWQDVIDPVNYEGKR